ncbi:nSTAND1 domain-containing NTPase [Streptodolium elevatio]|uniref:Novel STAND NTPase 1 domain-containing protein n=1 Tax=Streptodolium elevatio TaxID=3157996 RepID=A0ABV3DUX5_9ACTN
MGATEPRGELARLLRGALNRAGLQVSQLETRSGLKHTTVSQALNGAAVPTEATLRAFAAVRELRLDLTRLLALRTRALSGDGGCPYPGLEAFTADQAGLFFGRTSTVALLVERLDERSRRGGIQVVVGASGAGKTSVLRAGLIPALIGGALDSRWSTTEPVLFTPGAAPVTALQSALRSVLRVAPDGLGDDARRGADGGASPLELADTRPPDQPETGNPDIRATDRAAAPTRGTRPPACVGTGATSHSAPIGHASTGLVVIIDQFEEVFTECAEPTRQREFVAELAALAAPGSGGAPPRALVVIGVRADFYASCLHHPELVAGFDDGPVVVGPMTRAQLVEAITDPARSAKLKLRPELVERLLADLAAAPGHDKTGQDSPAGPEPATGQTDLGTFGPSDAYDAGRLPLLAHALRAAWTQRRRTSSDAPAGGTMTVEGYEATGGIAGAVQRSADRIWNGLDAASRRETRALFLRLVRLGPTAAEDTRHRARYESLTTASHAPDVLATVLEAFTDQRLLTRHRDTVQITHEALLYAWQRLAGWLREDRDGQLQRRLVEDAAADWDQPADGAPVREAAKLYSGSRLESATALAGRLAAGELSPVAAAFLDASSHAAAQVLRNRIRNRRLWRAAAAVVTVIAVLATFFAVQAKFRGDRLATERERTRSTVYAGQAASFAASDPSTAALYRLAAYRAHPDPQTLTALLAAANQPLWTSLDSAAPVRGPAVFSPDGRTLVTGVGSPDTFGAGPIQLWEVPAAGPPRRIGPAFGMNFGEVVFSPDGTTVASLGEGNRPDLWDISDRQRPRRRPVDLRPPPPPGALWSDTPRLAFSPDGRTLAVAYAAVVELWHVADANRPTLRAEVAVAYPENGSSHVPLFSPDGATLVTVEPGGPTILWNVTDPDRPQRRPTQLPEGTGAAPAFRADSRLLATTDHSGRLQLWDTADADRPTPYPFQAAVEGVVTALAFNAADRLAVETADGTDLWDTSQNTGLASLNLHLAAGTGVAFSPDGRTVASALRDSGVGLWHLPAVLPSYSDIGGIAASTADGRTLAVARRNPGTVRLWDLADPEQPQLYGPPLNAFPFVTTLALSSDGRTLAAGGIGLRLWDVSDPRHPVPRPSPDVLTNAIAFSPDGGMLATGDEKIGFKIWDLTSANPQLLLHTPDAHTGNPDALAFSADGRMLAVGGDDGMTVWDVSNSRQPGTCCFVADTSPVTHLAFSPDARFLASSARNTQVELWQLDGAAPQQRELPGSAGPVAFSTNGAMLLTGSLITVTAADILRPPERRTYLWAVSDFTDEPPAHPVTEIRTRYAAMSFGPDHQSVVGANGDGNVRWWIATADLAAARICRYGLPPPRATDVPLPKGLCRPPAA